MWDGLIWAAVALEEMAHTKHTQEALNKAIAAGDHGMAAAVLKVESERREHQRALAVARASAPVVNVTVRNYY